MDKEDADSSSRESLNPPAGDTPDQRRRTFDGLLIHHIGQFGRFQWFLFLSLSMTSFAATWHNLIHVFTGALPDFNCTSYSYASGAGAEGVNSSARLGVLSGHLPARDFLNVSGESALEDEEPGQCYTYLSVNGSQEQEYVPCTSWEYDRSQYKSSIVTQWDLVCHRKWMISFVQSLHMIGCLVGALLFGQLSDRYGRKPVLLVTTALEVTVGISTAFVPWFEMYAFCRFLVGMAVAGQANCAYVIAIELVGPKWRGIAGIMMLYLASLSIMLMSGLAYLVRDWQHFQLVISAPLALLLSYFVVTPESPRWLLVHKKMKKAKGLIKKLAKYNNKSLPRDYESWLNSEQESESNGRKYSTLDLFRTSMIRTRTFILFFLWFAVSVTYYGLSMYTSNLGGSDYLNFFLSGVVEIPAYTSSMWCLSRYGRRVPIGISMAASGVFLLLTSFFGDDQQIARIVLSMAGKMFISVAFVIAYPFSAELFPTVIRSNGLGVVSAGARVGGFVSPYILMLGDFATMLPLVVCGSFAFVGGILSFLLPETRNRQLPETLVDAELMRNNSVKVLLTRVHSSIRRLSSTTTEPDMPETCDIPHMEPISEVAKPLDDSGDRRPAADVPFSVSLGGEMLDLTDDDDDPI